MDSKELHKLVGQRIKNEREVLGWSQGQLSVECGVTQPRLSEIEAGKKDMYLSTAVRISRALGITLDWIVEGDDQ